MNDDLRELLDLLKSHGVDFLVIGAHAVSFYDRPRMTEDIDLWIGRDIENANRLKEALEEFGAPIGDKGARKFAGPDNQLIRLGTPPNMVDLLNFAGTRPFADVYSRRQTGEILGTPALFPDIDDLIEMKQAAGRPQDLADIARLRSKRARHA